MSGVVGLVRVVCYNGTVCCEAVGSYLHMGSLWLLIKLALDCERLLL